MADDMTSSYRSWSSRGKAASDQFEHQVQEQNQATDAIALDKKSLSEDSWRSDSQSRRQERRSHVSPNLSRDSLDQFVVGMTMTRHLQLLVRRRSGKPGQRGR
jgi:hypothetical protein